MTHASATGTLPPTAGTMSASTWKEAVRAPKSDGEDGGALNRLGGGCRRIGVRRELTRVDVLDTDIDISQARSGSMECRTKRAPKPISNLAMLAGYM